MKEPRNPLLPAAVKIFVPEVNHSSPPLQYILQSVRGHSVVVLTVTINGMQEIHPVIYSLFKFNHDWCLAPRRWGFYITHSDAPQSVRLLWTSGQPDADTSTWQHITLITDIYAPGGIRTHDLSRRAAVDLRLRPRVHWDRRQSFSDRIPFILHTDSQPPTK